MLFANVENFNSAMLHATCVNAATRNSCSSALQQSALFHLHLSLTTAHHHIRVCSSVSIYLCVWYNKKKHHYKILLLWHFSFYVAHRCATGNFYCLPFNCKRLLILLGAIVVVACILFGLDALYVRAHHKVCGECHAPAHNKITLTFKSMTWQAGAVRNRCCTPIVAKLWRNIAVAVI